MLGAVGILALEELLEDVADLERQAEEDVAGLAHAGGGGGVEDALDLGFVRAPG